MMGMIKWYSIFLCGVVLITIGCKTNDKDAEADEAATPKAIPEELNQGVNQKAGKKPGNPLNTFSSDRAARNNIPKNLKQVYLLLFEYDQDEGAYPPNLEVLEEKGYTTGLEELSTCSVNGQKKKFIYIPGFSAANSPDTVIMHTPEPVGGKRFVLFNDGSVRMISELDFQARIKKQTGPQ